MNLSCFLFNLWCFFTLVIHTQHERDGIFNYMMMLTVIRLLKLLGKEAMEFFVQQLMRTREESRYEED